MLTLQFVPFHEFSDLTQTDKITKFLDLVKEEKVLLLEGKLKSDDKSQLIAHTMMQIDQKFKGIEIEEIDIQKKDIAVIDKMKTALVNMLIGDKQGFTIIGPASIIKEIKRDPNKIQLFTQDFNKKKKK